MDQVLDIKGLVHRYPKGDGGDGGGLRVDRLGVGHGEQVVMTGRSGCGKSTLLHLVAGLMEPAQGVVRVIGTDVHGIKGAKRDRFRGEHIGMVFQTFNLLHGFSAVENVMAAMMFSSISKSTHRTHAESLLKTLKIERVGAKVEELSVGQQQRVAVARAVARSPELVLADEPTAALDPELTDEAMTMLQEACRSVGAALVCVTHDRSLVGRFDRHIEMASLSHQEEGA